MVAGAGMAGEPYVLPRRAGVGVLNQVEQKPRRGVPLIADYAAEPLCVPLYDATTQCEETD